jgi:S1-C subfamily serine protease
VTDEIAKELKLSSTKGVYIHETLKGSAAEKAGIKKGDIITNIDGTEIATASALQEKVNSYHPGDKATFTILREGNVKTVEVELQGDAEATGTVDTDGSIAFYGSKIKTAPKEKLEALGLKSGVEVVSVGDGKMLSAGASEGFIILYVNDQAVSKAEEVVEIAKKSRRAVYIEGVTASGRSSYFAFGKEE